MCLHFEGAKHSLSTDRAGEMILGMRVYVREGDLDPGCTTVSQLLIQRSLDGSLLTSIINYH